ncbi:penicillin-insensitive murein endopeptidase [Methylomonas sp. UP202]|uniref:penicillin-insensitive murein endopeptidase n=1 Tax=Methylomonas sp. UP202 TaxID=3040943 RepID=UPI002478DA94|nr:penicillin-insensitive murein endopeptidase [Methylomonas sp. UP202]WGS84559.1 penicillin-insensitive murein endopeptidase [Methylomonas sp. UP202]
MSNVLSRAGWFKMPGLFTAGYLMFSIRAFLTLLSAVSVFAAPTAAGSSAADWAAVKAPSSRPAGSFSIGSYTNGCIAGAASLPLQGPGYQVMRLSRQRYYGHAELIAFIQALGQTARDRQLGTLLIGDLGQARGGPTLSGHRSHQSGLDVDIWFLLSEQADRRVLSAEERETWSAPSVVEMRAYRIDRRAWSPKHAQVLEAAAQRPEVDRIFVHPAVKQNLCDAKLPGAGGWLRKIRPWWKHDDHFHVRLKCPADNPACQGQEPLPAGDGCDASLAWWFTEEAKTPAPGPVSVPPPLPALCEQLLGE